VTCPANARFDVYSKVRKPLKEVLVEWMRQQDPSPVKVLHLEGKVVKNAGAAPACAPAQEVENEIPVELQKPKADKALTQSNGADYLMSLKGNQPHALAKAQQLLSGAFSPGSPHDRQRPRTN
jgi:hypothetical protein